MDKNTALAYAINFLVQNSCENPYNEARWIIQELLADKESTSPILEQEDITLLNSLLQRRIKGEPLQYVLGNVDFHCLRLSVGPGVLIPRPETEILVEEALSLYPGSGDICDLCTGSGAIALAMAKQLPNTPFIAADISKEALFWAKLNQRDTQLKNVLFIQSDLFQNFPVGKKFSLLTANPPYVSETEYAQLPDTIKEFEPALALLADDNGLSILTRIIEDARNFLIPRAYMLLEIASSQAEEITEILKKNNYQDIRIKKDYTNRERIAIARAG